MKLYSFLTIAGLLAPAFAQSQCDSVTSAIPSCGLPCVEQAAKDIGCGALTNYACECSSSIQLAQTAFNCVTSACGLGSDAFAVLSGASSVCQCVASLTAAPAGGQATGLPQKVEAMETGAPKIKGRF